MAVHGDVGSHRYLIIGGTTKAATTSLFFYLRDHPEVCASTYKEARFFLDLDYPLPSKYRYSDGLERYDEFYAHCPGDRLRVEATPDLLHSSGTPRRIYEALPLAKLAFILREPVSRLVSWYRFAKQTGRIAETASFDDFVKAQRLDAGHAGNEQHLLVMRQGLYAGYLSRYIEIFGRERVLVSFYENLVADPFREMKRICDFTGIAEGYYKGYDFKVHNRTVGMRSSRLHGAYMSARYTVRGYTHRHVVLHAALRRLRLAIEPLYLLLNHRPAGKLAVSPATAGMLRNYYGATAAEVEAVAGVTPPWLERAHMDFPDSATEVNAGEGNASC